MISFRTPEQALPAGEPRGRPLELSDAALEQLAQRLSAASVLGEQDLPGGDPLRFELSYPVGP